MRDKYRTVQGDTWDSIAFSVTGNERDMNLLIQANPEHSGVAVFNGGTVLVIPEIDDAELSVNTLPPWKLVDE